MPEYVYAVHDFSPEHEDEIEFRAGDRIEVIEKDDMYGDGWWQVSTLSYSLLLFPFHETLLTYSSTAFSGKELVWEDRIIPAKLHYIRSEHFQQ